jgi:enoyl-CoA hydratase/carnithine racemase
MTAQVRIRVEGRAGRITLARPQALNALSHDMALAIERILLAWRDDAAVALVLIDAEGERAFCAGGDVEDLYRAGMAGDFAFGRRFWEDEYRLNLALAQFPKPVVALMQGFVMGGGVGIACHGSLRIACETTRIAMPECAIGLVPDVGGSLLLARAPGHAGEYLGLTGTRMGPADAILAGFADAFAPCREFPAIAAALVAEGDPAGARRFLAAPPPGILSGRQAWIDRHFSFGSALACLQSVEAENSEPARETAMAIRKACPLSVACAFELVRRARAHGDLGRALADELRFTARSQSQGEFLEGVRAQVIDKDRKPRWRTQRLEEVTPAMIERMLAPLQ